MEQKKVTTEEITAFLNGRDPQERIVSIECDYESEKVYVIYVDENGVKRIKIDKFKPFVWVKRSAAVKMFDGDRKLLRRKMMSYGINVKKLISNLGGPEEERLENGYKFLFYSVKPMSFKKFQMFFNEAKTPIYPRAKKGETIQQSDKEILAVSPVEQYMICTGKRLFKGYDNYDDLKRMLFDIESTGLNPRVDSIDQIGVRTNKGFERIIKVEGTGKEKGISEIEAITEFCKIIGDEKPDIIAGHNSENFDWDFIITRCEMLGYSFEDISKRYIKHPIYKKNKDVVLKLGGETEYYKPTILWGHNILDSLHAVRRAQAIDSSMESANLKYVTKYLNLNKSNRVYVKGNEIGKIWAEKSPVFAFNDENGDWYKVTEDKPLEEGYELKSGEYIVERYLLDDIWETDKVELTLNESNFLVCKMLPTSFSRACTMGTAGIWKLIMLAWSFENDLVVPAFGHKRRFTGGLSRLLSTGYVDRIVKLDYNSLYPSIILTWNINSKADVSKAMTEMLHYVLSQRELYKGLKADAGKKANNYKEQLKDILEDEEARKKLAELVNYWKSVKNANDKKQLPLKIFGNSAFGSFGSPYLFNWGDSDAAERTTCIGRQMLRLMISHFTELGYKPIVGDTDGFNFQMPSDDKFRYADEHPYISNGKGRNTVEGKAYTKVEADVAEFEDLYLNKDYNGGVNMTGLGVDEYCTSTINFARKNYADLMPDGSIKLVGNTIKSRKMAGYLKKFLDNGINLLLHGKGKEFLDSYYDYIKKIYNYQIPIQDIASKGKIKKSIREYKDDCNTLTKAGSKKSRQAWYELAIQEGIDPKMGDTVYYINTGDKRSHTDVKRVTHKYMIDENGQEIEITGRVTTSLMKAECEKEGIDYKTLKTKDKNGRIKKYITREYDEIILNCKMIPASLAESEDLVLCSQVEDLEYNVEKYIDQFNKRVKVLLVCFHPDIREKILIDNPSDIPYFTEAESQLVSGYPNKETDQDTYEALMTPERKEIEFWTRMSEIPPFVEECGIDWDQLVKDYEELLKEEQNARFQDLNKKYLEAIDNLTKEEVDEFEEEGVIPSSLSAFMDLDSSDFKLHFRDMPEMVPTTGGRIFDDIKYTPKEVEE